MIDGDNAKVLCLVRDLLFYSKIRAIAERAAVPLQIVPDPGKLISDGSALIVDLNQPGCLEAAVAWKKTTGKTVIGFVSHVDTETISAARAGGIDQVLARSQFERNLPKILEDPGLKSRV